MIGPLSPGTERVAAVSVARKWDGEGADRIWSIVTSQGRHDACLAAVTLRPQTDRALQGPESGLIVSSPALINPREVRPSR